MSLRQFAVDIMKEISGDSEVQRTVYLLAEIPEEIHHKVSASLAGTAEWVSMTTITDLGKINYDSAD
jgi:hypothetical protein